MILKQKFHKQIQQMVSSMQMFYIFFFSTIFLPSQSDSITDFNLYPAECKLMKKKKLNARALSAPYDSD